MNFELEQESWSLITPMVLAHPLHPINSRSRIKRRNLWVGRCVSSWWPLFPSRNSVLIYIYIYVRILRMDFGYRSYIYIHRECRSVLVKLHLITVYRTILGGSARFLCWMPLVVFFGFTVCVLLYAKWTYSRMLVTTGICFKQHFALDILRSAISHLPGGFCPWIFFIY